jgi:tetratricopeptide (TPR) repeat protein
MYLAYLPPRAGLLRKSGSLRKAGPHHGAGRPSGNRILGLLLLLGLSPLPEVTRGEDWVRIQGTRQQGEQRLTGEILEYSGQELRIRRTSGREEKYPPERVLEIQGTWSDPHRKAEQRLAERRAEEALPLLQEAIARERREWVRRRLLAHEVLACRETGNLERAVVAFAELLRSDPHTPHFAVIPLSWTSPLPSATRDAQAANWLNHSQPPIRLIGASWALTSTQRTKAIQALRALGEDPDSRIAYLARCQLWRAELAAASQRDVERWNAVIERMPSDLRAGPLLLRAQVLARVGEAQAAAVEFLRLPILYPEQGDLAAEGLWNAARQLDATGARDEAQTLYREFVADFPEHLHVARAQQRLGQSPSGP